MECESGSDYEKLEQLFTLCDRNNSGFIEEEDLNDLCDSLELDRDSILEIFAPLSKSGANSIVISKDDFKTGFAHIQQLFCSEEETGEVYGEEQEEIAVAQHEVHSTQPSDRRRSVTAHGPRSPRHGGAYNRSGSLNRLGNTPETSFRFSTSQDTLNHCNDEEYLESLSVSCHDRLQSLGYALRDLPESSGEGEPGDNKHFETIVLGLVNQFQQMEQEVGVLSDSLRKASTKHSEHISHLQDEMEAQLSRAEKTAFNLADKAASSKQKETERKLEAEISMLKEKLGDYRKLEEKINKERKVNEQNLQLKRQVEALSQENLSLRNSVLDAQTGIAALRAEMAKMQNKFDEQQMQIALEKETARSYQDEVFNLSKQLQSMQETSRRLNDTSDELNYAMEQNQSAIRMLSRSASPATSHVSRRSAHSGEASLHTELQAACPSKSPPDSNTLDASYPGVYDPVINKMYPDFNDESDSGRYSFVGSIYGNNPDFAANHDECDNDEDEIFSDCVRPEDSISMVNCAPPEKRLFASTCQQPAYTSNKIDLTRTGIPETRPISLNDELQQSLARDRDASSEFIDAPSRKVSKAIVNSPIETRTEVFMQSKSMNESVSLLNDHKHTARCDSNDTLNSEMSQETVLVKPPTSEGEDTYSNEAAKALLLSAVKPPPTNLFSPTTDPGYSTLTDRSTPSPIHYSKNQEHALLRKSLEPKNQRYTFERQYRVVLAGDAAVGKSSFILQLCTGYFHNRITSTLGVDFHTKAFDIDGKLTNLQLWDTAGQERFRAMAKNYFRRADGAILLYDVTFEQSFLHVRDWVETIESGANRKIPIIICANKSDTIAECIQKGIPYVSPEEGQALATSYDATFVEVSAKEGDNVLEAVVELSRQLWIAEDEERSNGLKLTAETPEEESKCCK